MKKGKRLRNKERNEKIREEYRRLRVDHTPKGTLNELRKLIPGLDYLSDSTLLYIAQSSVNY